MTPAFWTLGLSICLLVYPGTALLEGTNASEGRGTDAPFLLIGAPWLKAEAVIPSLPASGLTLDCWPGAHAFRRLRTSV